MLTWLSQDGRNAEKDGGSSFVVSPQQQLYRLHVSSPKFNEDLPVVSTFLENGHIFSCLHLHAIEFLIQCLILIEESLNHYSLFQDSDGSFESL